MPVVSVTRLRLRSIRYLPKLIWLAVQVRFQTVRSPGFVAEDYLRDPRLTFWSLTVWQDEASMRAFMSSGAHGRAAPHLRIICDEASGTSWEQETADLPGWKEAYERMIATGRWVYVEHPSEDQKRKYADPPGR